MSVPPQRGDGTIGGGAGAPLGGGPTPQPMDGLPPEMMAILFAMAQAMAARQQGGPAPGGGPGNLQGLFGGNPAAPVPTMAGPEPAPTPTAPTAGQGAMMPPQPGPSLTGGIGVPDVGGGGGFADFNRRNGLS